MPISLLCLGNPLLDIQAPVDAEYLAKYDLKADDAILAEEKHMPIYGEILQLPGVKLLAGGAAQNTARGAQTLLPAGSVAYVGSVGKDVYSEKLLAANAEAGVLTHYMFQEDVPTGKCAALITGVHRSLVTDLGAANHYKPEHLKEPQNWALVEEAKAFYVGGYHLTVSPPAILALAEHAAAQNKPFCLNMSAPFLPAFFKDAFDSTSPYWDYLIGNESEALSYAESHGLETQDIPTIAKALATLPKVNEKRERVIVITQGLDDTIVVVAKPGSEPVVTCFPVHELPQNKVADSNGAGDAFAGGFMAGIVEGRSLETAVDMGQFLARESIQLIGPSFPKGPLTYPGK